MTFLQRVFVPDKIYKLRSVGLQRQRSVPKKENRRPAVTLSNANVVQTRL